MSLRQCLIALWIAEAGLGEQDRAAVYYAALLVNVGCHADAHEQLRWFWTTSRSSRVSTPTSAAASRGALAAMRLVGAGNPPWHRFRSASEFALSRPPGAWTG